MPISSDVRRRTLLGLLLSSCLALLTYRRRMLSRSGAVGAVITGTTSLGPGGWSWGLSLIFFFLSSSLFSHFRARDKAQIAADKFSKGSQRDLAQVMANAGVATALSLANGLTSSPRLRSALQAGFVGTLATANADTWATELGTLSRQQPRSITTGKPVAPGTSGGVTLLGSTAAALGAIALGLCFWLLQGDRKALFRLPIIALISGLAGSLFDSLLGATVQAMYFCPVCQKETERRIHNCGTRTKILRGIPWINNDGVNFLATLAGAWIAVSLHEINSIIRRELQQREDLTI